MRERGSEDKVPARGCIDRERENPHRSWIALATHFNIPFGQSAGHRPRWYLGRDPLRERA